MCRALGARYALPPWSGRVEGGRCCLEARPSPQPSPFPATGCAPGMGAGLYRKMPKRLCQSRGPPKRRGGGSE